MKYFSSIIIFFMLIQNSCSQQQKEINGDLLQYTFLKDKAIVNPVITGVWKSVGYGYYLEARMDRILLYSYTKNYCYKEKNDHLEGLLNKESQFRQRGDTLEIYMTNFGLDTERLQTKWDYVKMEKLPDHCIGFDEMKGLPATKLFQLYRETMEENYAFKERRGFDLDSIFDSYQDRVSNDDDSKSLFQTMGAIATLTKDHHTKVISENGEALQYRVTPSAEIVQQVFKEQTDVKDLNEYFNLYFDWNYRNISKGLLDGKGKKVVNDKLEWGNLTDKIGYLNIHSFTGYASPNFTRKQQIDSLDIHMKNIVTAFQDKDAVIIDVSFNFGGYDATALTIAGYFTDEPILAYTSQIFTGREFYKADELVIYPADSIRFTKPVFLLMTDVSRSEAECFAMMMDALPNVTLVGSNTLGIFSGMLGKSIGNFFTTFSNQRLVTVDGQFYEGVGVEPDIRIEVFPKEDVFNGHRSAVNKIIEIIKNN